MHLLRGGNSSINVVKTRSPSTSLGKRIEDPYGIVPGPGPAAYLVPGTMGDQVPSCSSLLCSVCSCPALVLRPQVLSVHRSLPRTYFRGRTPERPAKSAGKDEKSKKSREPDPEREARIAEIKSQGKDTPGPNQYTINMSPIVTTR